MFYVNEEKLNKCSRINIYVGNQSIPAVVDTGSKLKSEGVKNLELGVQNAVLVSAFGSKTKRIRMQAMLPLCIDNIVLDHIF
jgi:thiazole synthase ThiGH ThiG subunit